MKNKHFPIVAPVLMACAIPFYFIGLFSMRDLNGTLILGSLRFWGLGFTRNLEPYYAYIDGSMPGMITTAIIALIFSLLLNILFIILYFSMPNRQELKKNIVTTIIAVFSFANYMAGFSIIFLFYTTSHSSFVRECSAHLGIGAYFVLLLEAVAVGFLIVQLASVLEPYLIRKRESAGQTPATRKQGQKGTYNNRSCMAYGYSDMYGIPPQPSGDRMRALLVFTGGDYKGGKIELPNQQELLIGKDPAICSVVISKKYGKISRKHCGVMRKDYQFFIRDYSTNGIYSALDKEKIEAGGGFYKLKPNEMINLAKTDIEFYCELSKQNSFPRR